jgi:hypothetical protein
LVIIAEIIYLWGNFSFFTNKKAEYSNAARINGEFVMFLIDQQKEEVIEDVRLSVTYNGALKNFRNKPHNTGGKYGFVAELTIYFIQNNGKENKIHISKEGLEKITYYEKRGNSHVVISQDQIKPGDKIKIMLEADLVKHPKDSIIKCSIIKV